MVLGQFCFLSIILILMPYSTPFGGKLMNIGKGILFMEYVVTLGKLKKMRDSMGAGYDTKTSKGRENFNGSVDNMIQRGTSKMLRE